MARSRTLLIPLSLLGLFLLGTVIVLSTVSYYLAIEPTAYLTDTEVPATVGRTTNNHSRTLERIPRIIHQTWKTDVLPDRWRAVSKTCTSLMPDYEYMLWTDEKSREFIAKEYSWFLPTYDGYAYPIQRADAIRYFVLHYYGGVYLDLDVGCMRPLDTLLQYPVILAKTIPVGVSNDLMFSAKGHPFMEQTIHNLITFDHNYFLNYPTVMFSTGPMYVSAQYGLYIASHPHRPPAEDVRVLAKSLYGKNASPLEAPHSFFSHHYGSSWHADDAAFITFLGKWGRLLMRFGTIVLVFGLARVYWSRRRRGSRASLIRRRLAFITPVQLLLPRSLIEHPSRRYGHRHNLSGGSSDEAMMETSPLTSPDSSYPPSPTLNSETPRLTLAGRRGSSQRRMGAGRTSDGSQSFIAFLPTIFTPVLLLSRSGRRSSSHAGRGDRGREKLSDPEAALSEATEAKAREAGFRLPPPTATTASPPRTPLSSGSLGLEASGDERESDRSGAWSPLLIDPLGGSDVRTTRSASASIAVAGAPPPYRAATIRTTSFLGSEASGLMTP